MVGIPSRIRRHSIFKHLATSQDSVRSVLILSTHICVALLLPDVPFEFLFMIFCYVVFILFVSNSALPSIILIDD